MYIRRKGGNYYVQFRLEDGSLSNHKSTGTPNYNEARKLAMQWYSSGQIPERINSISEKHKMSELEKVQLIKQLKIYDFEYEDIQTIVDILVSRNFLVSGILKASPESRQAVDYLLEFWDYDKSPYREERAVLGKNLSYSYFETALGIVKKYWAHQKHLTQFSNFNDIPKVTVKGSKKKDILRADYVSKVFGVTWGNEMSRLANLLAMYTGMRVLFSRLFSLFLSNLEPL